MCLYPKLIINPKYKANKKNGGNVPPVTDERVKYVPIGCQNCLECRKKKAREWQIRLQEDIKEHTNGKFVTLTFTDKSIQKIYENIKEHCQKNNTEIPTGYTLDNEIAVRGTRLFLERWRKEYKKSVRHWLVTELGHNGTENIHIHGIIWTNQSLKTIEEKWQYGYIWPKPESKQERENYVNQRTINYIIKYVNKIDEKHKHYKSIILTSSGIGNRYTKQKIGDWQKNKYNETKTNETYRTKTGNKLSLPIYYRNKIYTEEQRENLWIQKLNKEERWILGIKIDISKGEEEYNKALAYAQKNINKELGYGDDKKNWEQAEYERQQRILNQKTRIAKAKQAPSERVLRE